MSPQGVAVHRENIERDTRKLIWVLADNKELMMPRQGFYEVERLINKRKLPNNRVEYLVRWRGYSKKHDTWEPINNLNTCKDLIQDFDEVHKKQTSSTSLKTKIPTKNNVPEPLNLKEKRIIKPAKIYSPEPYTKQKSQTKSSFFKVNQRPSEASSKSPPKALVSKVNERHPNTVGRDARQFRSLRALTENLAHERERERLFRQSTEKKRAMRKRRSTSPVHNPKAVRKHADAPLSPMSKQALDHFLASRARNFNHMNRIHTRPPSADHEYFTSSSGAFAVAARKISQPVTVSTIKPDGSSKDARSEASTANNKLASVHGLKELNYKFKVQARQLHVYTRGKCMEIVIANERENNACTPEVLDEIVRMLEDAMIAPVHLVLFRSVGDFFCSGFSTSAFSKLVESGKPQSIAAERYAKSLRNFVNCLIDFPKPVVAVVKGPAIGLGCAMLPHFDTVYCSERAYFCTPYTEVGLTPEACSSFLFPKILGHCLANDMLLHGKPITAVEAKTAGLVSEVFHHDSLEQNVLPLAKHLITKSLEGLITTKELIRNPDRSRLKHINQCEYIAAKERWMDPEIL